jgi:hypothetical protein
MVSHSWGRHPIKDSSYEWCLSDPGERCVRHPAIHRLAEHWNESGADADIQIVSNESWHLLRVETVRQRLGEAGFVRTGSFASFGNRNCPKMRGGLQPGFSPPHILLTLSYCKLVPALSAAVSDSPAESSANRILGPQDCQQSQSAKRPNDASAGLSDPYRAAAASSARYRSRCASGSTCDSTSIRIR